MAWDDEPPPQTSATASWDSAPPSPEELTGKSVMGAVRNLGTDIVDTGKGLYNAAKQVGPFAAKIPMHELESIKQIATGTNPMDTPSVQDLKTMGETGWNMGKGLVHEGQRIGLGELLTGHPVNAVEKFGNAAYNKPLTTALDVLPAVGAVGKTLGFGADAAKGAGLASEAADAGSLADDMAQAGKTAVDAIPEAASDTGFRVANKLRGKTYIGEPGDLHVDLMKRMAEAEGVPESVMYDTMNKIGDQGFTQGGKFLTRDEASAAAGGVPGEAASLLNAGKMEPPMAPGVGEDLARSAATAPSPLEMPGEANQILKQAPGMPTGSVPTGSTFQETVQNLGKQIPGQIKEPLGQVNDFLNQKYGKLAAQEGWPETLGNMMSRKAQSMRFQEMGASPGQIRKLIDRFGEDKVRALSDLAEDKGITEPVVGYKIGKNIDNLEKTSGQTIGGIRQIATQRGALHDPAALVQKIRAELDPIYLGEGTASGQKGAYMKALKDIKEAGPNPDAIAEKISYLNKYATKNKMTQATGALSDVANTASKFNNELITQHLSPAEAAAYKDALRDFGASQIYKKFYGFRAGRELSGRAGPGGIIRNIKQAAMDVGGNKLLEKTFDKFGRRLKATPEIAKSLGTLSHEAMNDILSSLDEVIDEAVK